MMKGKLLALIMGLLLLPASFAFAQEKTLKVGVYGPLTGAQALVGQEFKNSTMMAFEEIGYKIGDYNVELVWIDCQYDPTRGINAYSEAIEQKGVQVGLHNWGSSTAVATMDLVSKFKIPHLFGTGSAVTVNEKYATDPEKYAYWSTKSWPIPGKLMVYYSDAIEGAIKDGTLKIAPEEKIMAIYGEDSDWGRSCGSAMREVFEKNGWKIVAEDYFPTTQTDFYSMLSRLKSQNVRLLAGTTQYPAMGALVKQIKELQMDTVVIADGIGWVGNWHELTGPLGDGMLDMIPQLATPEAKEWAEKFEKEFGNKPGATGGLAYDLTRYGIKIFDRALEKYGTLDSETIQKIVMEEVHTGQLQFTQKEDGAVVNSAYKFSPESVPDMIVGTDAWFLPVLQYNADGTFNIVYPKEIATGEFKVVK